MSLRGEELWVISLFCSAVSIARSPMGRPEWMVPWRSVANLTEDARGYLSVPARAATRTTAGDGPVRWPAAHTPRLQF
jgi:hypothetical protein